MDMAKVKSNEAICNRISMSVTNSKHVCACAGYISAGNTALSMMLDVFWI